MIFVCQTSVDRLRELAPSGYVNNHIRQMVLHFIGDCKSLTSIIEYHVGCLLAIGMACVIGR
jgi:hypothetical protein